MNQIFHFSLVRFVLLFSSGLINKFHPYKVPWGFRVECVVCAGMFTFAGLGLCNGRRLYRSDQKGNLKIG